MEFVGEYIVPASRDEVWRALNDPDVLKHCIPGCESLERVSDTDFDGRLVMKLGAIKARLKGKVTLSEIDAPNSYTITGQGQSGAAGFAKGGAKVLLLDSDGGATLLQYQATAQLGGKLATVGSRVFQGIARKTTDDFFSQFAARFGGGPTDDRTTETIPIVEDRVKGVSTASVMQSHRAADPMTTRRDFKGTLRDLLWLVIGIGVGALVTWALMT